MSFNLHHQLPTLISSILNCRSCGENRPEIFSQGCQGLSSLIHPPHYACISLSPSFCSFCLNGAEPGNCDTTMPFLSTHSKLYRDR